MLFICGSAAKNVVQEILFGNSFMKQERYDSTIIFRKYLSIRIDQFEPQVTDV